MNLSLDEERFIRTFLINDRITPNDILIITSSRNAKGPAMTCHLRAAIVSLCPSIFYDWHQRATSPGIIKTYQQRAWKSLLSSSSCFAKANYQG